MTGHYNGMHLQSNLPGGSSALDELKLESNSIEELHFYIILSAMCHHESYDRKAAMQIFNEAWGEFDVANQTQIAMSVDPAFGTGSPNHFLFSDASGWTDHNVTSCLIPIFVCDSVQFFCLCHLILNSACGSLQLHVHVIKFSS